MPAAGALCRRRQLVEQLDSNVALLDYLHQNGALSQQGEACLLCDPTEKSDL